MSEQATHRAMVGRVLENLQLPFAQVTLDDDAFEGWLVFHRFRTGSARCGAGTNASQKQCSQVPACQWKLGPILRRWLALSRQR
jgi:hypothetical protein